MEFSHIPIMPTQTLDLLAPNRGGVFVDGTLGGGGHAELVREALTKDIVLIGIDRDQGAVDAATKRLSRFGEKFMPVKGNFFDIKAILKEIGVDSIDGMMADLGVSSYQLDNPQRGFSYHNDAPLDMRMDKSAKISATEVINQSDERRLAQVIR